MSDAGSAPARLLVAEDEAPLASILVDFLRSKGFLVQAVHDGAEALDALRTGQFDVALLDIVLPRMDGLDVLRHIRSEPTPPEVIIITGSGTMEGAISALRLGAFDYLSKPYRLAEIEVVVRRACAQHAGFGGGAQMAERGLSNGNGNGHATPLSIPSLRDLERTHIGRVLHSVDWHQGRAATILGISSKTLYRKIREYGLERPI